MLRYLAPSFGSSSSPHVGGEGDRGVSRDLFVAEIIQSEADDGNPFARELVKDSRAFLGAASIHSSRAHRLRKGAMKASRMGYHSLARMGMEAARAQEGAATTYAAQVTSMVRRSQRDLFGYITPEEERQQRRNLYLESLSAEQREGVMNELLDRVMQTSVNYGVDDPYAIEVDDGAMGEIYAAASCFGADLDTVFGAGIFKQVGEAIRPAITKLKQRVDDLESRLEALEGGEPTPKRERKAKTLRRKKAQAKEKLEAAEETAEAVEEAEEKSDQMGAMEAAALVDDPKADLMGMDDALMFGADLFGLSDQRRAKIEKRIERLEQKVLDMQEKGASDKKIAMLQKRIERLQAKLDEGEDGKTSEESLPDALVTKQPKAYSKDEFLSSFFGAEGTPRRAFVGYFTRRAEHMGIDVSDAHASFGATDADDTRRNLREFFEDVGLSIQTAFNPSLRAEIRKARDEARAAFNVDAKLSSLRSARRDYLDALEQSRAYTRQMGRYLRNRGDAPTLPSAAKGPVPGTYRNMPGGYDYKLSDDGSITILKSPRGGKPKPVSSESKAGKAILAQLEQYPQNRA